MDKSELLSFEDQEDTIQPLYNRLKFSLNNSYEERFKLFIKYLGFIEDLVSRHKISISQGAYEVVSAFVVFRKGDPEFFEQREIFDVAADLEVFGMGRTRPLSDWKIIQDFIKKYSEKRV